MAYRKSYRANRTGRTNWTSAVPRWSQTQTDTTNLIFREWMGRIGVTDIRSYFERLLVPIVICVVLGAVIGTFRDGWSGMFWYALAGIAAPAAIPWLFIVVGFAVFLALAYVAVWTVLIYGVLWILSH
jgi:hypothetical protein